MTLVLHTALLCLFIHIGAGAKPPDGGVIDSSWLMEELSIMVRPRTFSTKGAPLQVLWQRNCGGGRISEEGGEESWRRDRGRGVLCRTAALQPTFWDDDRFNVYCHGRHLAANRCYLGGGSVLSPTGVSWLTACSGPQPTGRFAVTRAHTAHPTHPHKTHRRGGLRAQRRVVSGGGWREARTLSTQS